MKKIAALTLLVALTVLGAPAAHADPDIDFANQLHAVGIYGPRDYNAWIAKIACERLDNGIDRSAADSARFVARQLPKDATAVQSWQFAALAYSIYCPDRQALLQQAATTQPS